MKRVLILLLLVLFVGCFGRVEETKIESQQEAAPGAEATAPMPSNPDPQSPDANQWNLQTR